MSLIPEKQDAIIDLYLTSDVKTIDAKFLPKSEEEQEVFFEIAEHNKTSARLYLQLRDREETEHLKLTERLKEQYLKIRERNVTRLEVGVPILKVLKAQGIEVIILKGNALAEEYFSDIGYKPMNDIDILVKKEDLPKIYDQFLYHDLLTAAPLEEDIKKQEKISHHWPPFFDRKFQVFFGTHWNIAAPTRGLEIPIEDFWKEKEEFTLMGEKFFRLSPAHFILHLCVHLNSAKTGLREVGDLAMLIEKRSNVIDTDQFTQMVVKAGVEKEVYEALTLSQALLKNAFNEKILKNLDPIIEESFKAKVLKRITPRYKFLHLRTSYVSKIEKTFALFMLTEDPKEKTALLAKMWKLYLFVPASEALRLSYDFPRGNALEKLWAQLKAPFKISQVFIQDLGLFIFLFVTARHQWVLFMCYYNFLQKKSRGETVLTLEGYAQELGLSFKEIKEVSALD